jgi:DNA-binding PadR family transcriptional regulator
MAFEVVVVEKLISAIEILHLIVFFEAANDDGHSVPHSPNKGNGGLVPFPSRWPRHTSGLQPAYLFFIVEHMSREVLGNFELMVMLALIRLGDAAYGVPISKIIEESTNREVLVGSVYAALERLEAKGFVLSEVGEPTPERGGRAKRYFRITDNGLRQVRDTRGALVKLWKGIPALQGGT